MRAVAVVDEIKNDKLTLLPMDGLLALGSISAPDLTHYIVERIDRGELTTARQIKAAIRENRRKASSLACGAEHTNAAVLNEGGVATKGSEVWRIARSHAEPVTTTGIQWSPGVAPKEKGDIYPPLASAIHAVEILSGDDLAAFDLWYRDTFRTAQDAISVEVDTTVPDKAETSMPTADAAPERGVAFTAEVFEDDMISARNGEVVLMEAESSSLFHLTEIEDNPIIAAWRDFKLNPQKCGRAWVLNGAPAEVPGEHFLITERLAPWREAYRMALPEQQQSIRQWLERQRL